jgi:hypothetical protein
MEDQEQTTRPEEEEDVEAHKKTVRASEDAPSIEDEDEDVELHKKTTL